MTIIIVVITAIASIACFSNQELLSRWIFNPYKVHHQKQWYRFITSGFIHHDVMHLAVNMLVFFSFGTAVENYYSMVFPHHSRIYFVLLYLGALVFATTPSYSKQKNNPYYNALGASGAVAAILFAAVLFNPLGKIYIMGVIPLPGIAVAVLYVIYEYYAGKKGGDNIGHDAHLWGAAFGAGFTILLKPAIIINFIQQLTGS